MKPVLYLSHFFKVHRERYYDLLQNTREQGDFESWLKFFLEGVASVSLEATDTARKIVDLREQHRALIVERLGRTAGKGIDVLERLFRSPFVTVPAVADALDVTFQAANNLVGKLEDAEVIREATGQRRNRVFVYEPYVRLFQ